MMAKVSIIIPVYNAEKSLPRCFDSILKQTFRDFEVIVINDGSTDRSQEVIQIYVEKYPDKFYSFIQMNQGAAAARNKGIEFSRSEYILFIDNDDYVSETYLQELLTEADSSHADMVLTGYCRITENGKIIYKRMANNSDWILFQLTAPWARVYRRSFISENKLSFLSNSIGEDVFFNVLAACRCKKKSYVPSISYFWVYNTQSVSNTNQKGMKEIASPFALLQKIYDETKPYVQNEPLKSYIEYYFIRYAVWYILFSGRNADPNTAWQMHQEMFTFICKLYPNYNKNRYIRLALPKGETFFNRFTVCFFLILNRLHGVKLFLSVYCRGSKK